MSQRGEHPPSHKDNAPLGAKGQEEPSAGIPQTPRPAFAREDSPAPLCPQGPGGRLSSRGVKKGKERERRSFQRSGPPSQGAAHNPEKKRKRTHSGDLQSHQQGQRLQGLDAREGPGGLLPKVRGKAGNTPKTPEGKGKAPPLARKPAGPPPELHRAAAEEQELDPRTMSFEAYLTYDQPPARKKRKSGKTPATALQAKGLGKEDSTGAKAEAGKSQKPPPPGAAGAPRPVEPPDPTACPALPVLGPCQPREPPLAALPLTSSFQPRPRALLPSPRPEEGAGLMGIRLSSRTQVFFGPKRARRSRMLALLQDCVQTLQNSVYLLSRARGVPCSLPEPVLERDAPEQLPRLEGRHGALAAQTDPLWKEHCQRALEKDTREEPKPLREPQEQEVAGQVLQISANRPKDPPAKMAFSDTRGAAAAVQEKVLPAPSPTAGSPDAPSVPASGHSGHPMPGKQVLSSHKKPVKKIAPLMAKSIRDYKNRYSR